MSIDDTSSNPRQSPRRPKNEIRNLLAVGQALLVIFAAAGVGLLAGGGNPDRERIGLTMLTLAGIMTAAVGVLRGQQIVVNEQRQIRKDVAKLGPDVEELRSDVADVKGLLNDVAETAEDQLGQQRRRRG